MQTSFTPSVNIVRDQDKQLRYLPTGNSHRVYQQIAAGFRTGTRSFNIIGSYGTGKSAFLWAVERQLANKATYFGSVNGHFDGTKRFESLNIIGEYDSIIKSFARHIGIKDRRVSEQLILKKLGAHHDKAAKYKAGLLIVVDELGKYLEFASTKDPERELYFIQQLAEFCNNSSKRFLLLTSLHQGFDSYARGLDLVQRHEWEKVKGRLTELPFNEQIAQLLFLAAEYLRTESIERGHVGDIDSIASFTQKARSCNFDEASIVDIAKNLLPLEPIAASVLTLALQEIGQNERSLFTFLSSHDHLGVRAFDRRSNPLYNLGCVYDYLMGNHYSVITSRDNPRYVQWAAIQRAIERVEGVVDKDAHDALKVVKAIGLLNIYGLESTRFDTDVLHEYGKISLGITEPTRVARILEDKKIIRFIQFKNRYVLFDGTDFDFGAAFQAASSKVDMVTEVVPKLQEHFSFPAIRCKAATLKRGTPRFFEFQISVEPISSVYTGEIDGIINFVFPRKPNLDEIKVLSRENKDAIVYCLFTNTSSIQTTLWDIEKSKSIIASLIEDPIARREVRRILDGHVQQLNQLVIDSMFNGVAKWIFHGKEILIRSQLDLNRYLSSVVESIYNQAPVFDNELINRHRLPSAVATARNKLVDRLLSKADVADLGFPKEKFPPEKTIYLTLLKNTGVHRKRSDGWSLGKPTDKTFHALWSRCEEFLIGTKSVRKPIADFFEILQTKPLKMKKGFSEVWVPVFLIIWKEDYALFDEKGYIPHLTADVIDLIIKNPERFFIKAFDIGGVRLDLLNRYRAILTKEPTTRISSSSFVDTIRPFLTFYRGLPEYSKQTIRLSPCALAFRDAIAKATDPEKAFFEDIPSALGYRIDDLRKRDDHLQSYVQSIQESIREIRTSYEGLVDRVEASLVSYLGYEGIPFTEYQNKLQSRYLTLRKYLLQPKQKSLLQRVTSKLDDRHAWIGSIAQSVLGKALEFLRDDEEDALHSNLLDGFRELDNLCEVVANSKGTEGEEVFRVETTTLSNGTRKKVLRIPATKLLKAGALSDRLKRHLTGDKDVNAAALLKLLTEDNENE